MATFDYTSRDFLSIRQDLLNRAARTIPEWDSTDASDFGNVFVDLWAYMGDILHYYIDRAAGEAFLPTATQRESIMSIANLLDYIPSSAKASRGSVIFQLSAFPALAVSYTIPQYTVLTGYDDAGNAYPFYTVSDSLPLTSTTVGDPGNQAVVSVVQGSIITNEALGKSNGTADQRVTLVKKNVDTDSVSVTVMEGPLDISGDPTAAVYRYVPQLSVTHYLDKVFTTHLLSDGSTQIVFGNGFNGAIPTSNADMTVTYRTSSGASGNLPQNKVVSISGTPASYVTIVSSSATSGGADEESLESIRDNVSRLYRTQDRAVSLQDYKDLCLQIPGISKATAAYNPSTSVVTLYPVPHQSSYPPAAVSNAVFIGLSEAISSSVNSYFSTRSMLGVGAYVTGTSAVDTTPNNISCTPIYVRLKVHVKDNYVQSWVEDQVVTQVKSLLTFSSVQFGQIVTIGDIYRLALSVVGVDYVELLNLSTTYYDGGVSGDAVRSAPNAPANITVDYDKLPCFADDVNGDLAVTCYMVGGLTGSN